ncbi:hypothetical protein FHS18_000958 [Paenibacillus phyllosphaerae]|uniref:Uncharacterized protein n=1 Tax=Paenibacillus phyllosphaerae TaxID=274593 RepID=A0A7W5AVF6_9BACL|nr:hypothetical protein [Paenibacillus phyllosphaerae]
MATEEEEVVHDGDTRASIGDLAIAATAYG